ncbi:MAG TPA: YncE family protein [Burkholderiales bacterium]
MKTLSIAAAALLLAACAEQSVAPQSKRGNLAVSANDNKAILVNGVTTAVPNAAPDTVALIDLSVSPPRLVSEIDVPASVVGPPSSVAVAPDESIALVTAAMRIEGGKQVPNDKVSVIDLTVLPPRVINTLTAGAGVAGISINRQGTLALAANRSEGTVSVFTVKGKNVSHLGKLRLGDEKSGPSHAVFTPDGGTALVSRDGDNRISVLSIKGNIVEHTKRDIFAGQRPYGIDVCMPGAIAVVANIGIGQGDADTISVIDLQAQPPRVIETITVGQTPEGIACSPNGRKVAVVAMSGSNKAKESPFYRANGRVVMFNVEGKKLTPAGEADTGNWSQGAAFSADSRTLLVGNMVQKNLQVYELSASGIRDTGQRVALRGGAAGIRTAD